MLANQKTYYVMYIRANKIVFIGSETDCFKWLNDRLELGNYTPIHYGYKVLTDL